MTHTCVGKFIINGSDNGLSPRRRQAIIWTNAGVLLIRLLKQKFSDILIAIQRFSFNIFKIWSAKWWPFPRDLNVLILHQGYETLGRAEMYATLCNALWCIEWCAIQRFHNLLESFGDSISWYLSYVTKLINMFVFRRVMWYVTTGLVSVFNLRPRKVFGIWIRCDVCKDFSHCLRTCSPTQRNETKPEV